MVIVNDTMIIKVEDISLYQKIAPDLIISSDTALFLKNLCDNFIYPLFFDKSDYTEFSDSSDVITSYSIHYTKLYEG